MILQDSGHGVLVFFETIEHQEASTSGTGNLTGGRSILQRHGVTFVGEAGLKTGSRAALLLPVIMQEPCKVVQVTGVEAFLYVDFYRFSIMSPFQHRPIL